MAERGTFLTIADEMVRLIKAGDWSKGEPIPSEADLTARFQVARGTVRSALRVVEERGLIDVKPGRGRFVAADETGQSATASATAAYEQVAQAVVRLINEQGLAPDSALPSEATLMEEHKV